MMIGYLLFLDTRVNRGSIKQGFLIPSRYSVMMEVIRPTLAIERIVTLFRAVLTAFCLVFSEICSAKPIQRIKTFMGMWLNLSFLFLKQTTSAVLKKLKVVKLKIVANLQIKFFTFTTKMMKVVTVRSIRFLVILLLTVYTFTGFVEAGYYRQVDTSIDRASIYHTIEGMSEINCLHLCRQNPEQCKMSFWQKDEGQSCHFLKEKIEPEEGSTRNEMTGVLHVAIHEIGMGTRF